MSDRSLKSVTYFSFDQLSEEEQEVQGAQCPPQAFQLPHIGGQVSVPAAGDAETDTHELDSCESFCARSSYNAKNHGLKKTLIHVQENR